YKGRAPRANVSGRSSQQFASTGSLLDRVLEKLSEAGPCDHTDDSISRFASYFARGKSFDFLTATDLVGRTALMLAAEQGETASTQTVILAAVGAFQGGRLNWFSWVHQKDNAGRTALQLAESKQHKVTVAAMEVIINKHLNDRSTGLAQRYPEIRRDRFGQP